MAKILHVRLFRAVGGGGIDTPLSRILAMRRW
jgi:hypothetical protein